MKLDENEIKELGEILRNRRKEKDFTLEQVKIKLEHKGLVAEITDIFRIEQGERKIPNPKLVSLLAVIYDLDPIELFKKIGYLPNNFNEKSNDKKYVTYNDQLNEIAVYTSANKFFKNKNSFEYKIYLKLKSNSNTFFAVKEKESTIVIDIDSKVNENDMGLFLLNEEYIFAKKKTSERGDYFLITNKKEELPILVKRGDKYKEIGKIVGIYNSYWGEMICKNLWKQVTN